MGAAVQLKPISHQLDLRVLRFRNDPGRDEPSMLGQELIGQERFDEAVELTAAALENDPRDGDLLLVHGIALSHVGQLETAQLALMRAANLDQSWAEPWRHLARILYERGRVDQARVVAERALALDPDDPLALRVHRDADLVLRARRYADEPSMEEPSLLAQQLLAAGHPALAFEVTRTALLEELDDEDLLVTHARAAIALGDLDEALSVLSTATFEAPDWPEVWRLLAEVYALRGEPSEVRRAAEQGLALEPDDEGFKALLRSLPSLGAKPGAGGR